MTAIYDKILKRKLETYREDILSELKVFKVSDNFQYPNDAVRLVILLDQVEAKMSKLEQFEIIPPRINVKEMIEDKYREDIVLYKEKCRKLKESEQSKISKLNKEKDDIIKANRKDLDFLLKENYNQLSPYIIKHDYLKSKRSELEDIFRLYCIKCNGYEIDATMSLKELDELFDLAKYGIESVLRDKKWTNKVCELMYLPRVLEFKEELTSIIFSIVWFITLVLICVFGKVVLALVSVIYLINMLTNVTKVLQRKELIQMAYAISSDIDFAKYLNETPEILEIRENLEEAMSYDLSDRIAAISKESLDKISAIEDPAEDMEAELTKATVAMSDGIINAEINRVVKECYNEKEDILSHYETMVNKLKEILARIPKDVIGDDIINSDLLSTKMRIGSVNSNGKPVTEVSIEIPFQSIGFLYKDDTTRSDVLEYLKLILANYISNVNPKQLIIDIYDEIGLGSELSEFIGGEALNYIRTVTSDFNKLFGVVKADLENNINNFRISDIQAYNREAMEIGKTTIKYRMLVILSGVSIETNETLKNFIIEKTKQGLIVLFLYKDLSCFKDDIKAKLTDLYSKVIICKKYGELVTPDNDKYGSVEKPAEQYEYKSDIGTKVMYTYNKLLKERNDPSLDYTKDYRLKQIPEEKYWTWNTLMGIEVRFGYVDGDPTKAESMVFGDNTPHCLTVGRTGSGKSVFINNALANMTLMYSPEWLTLCMIDFKNTEFFIFQGEAAIPHAKLVAGTTDGEYAVSVFEYIDEEMTRRNKIFLAVGTKNIVEYNKKIMSGQAQGKIMPRMLFVIDEFQVMFNKVDSKSLMKIESAIISLSKVARSAGCHLWFASQSMTGTMSADILAQFKLRVALGCDEKLSSEILGNPAASKIDRLGYSYTNDSGGTSVNANKYWRTPYITTPDFLNYLKAQNEKCVREGIFKREYRVFNEEEKFEHTKLEEWLEHPKIKADQDLFVLGEPTFFSVNEFPPTLSLFKDNSENIIYGTYDTAALLNGINTFITNIKSKENTELIIHCLDKDIGILLGAEEKVTPKYKAFLNNDIMNLDTIFKLMETTLQARMDNPTGDYPRIFFIGIGWDKMDGLGENMRMAVETRMKTLLDKSPKYGIHYIIANKDIAEFKVFKKNFIHRIGSKLDSKSAGLVEDNDKLVNKEFMNHVAIYSTDAEEVKFKLYQFPTVGTVRTRGIEVKNYD